MKASDLRACDSCGGQLAGRKPDGTASIQFYVVKISAAFVDFQAVNERIGLALMLGGSSALAEVFAPRPEVAHIVGDQPGAAWDEALLCFDCYCKPIRLAALAEKVSESTAARAEGGEHDLGGEGGGA